TRLELVELREGVAERDFRGEFVEAGRLEIVLGLEHKAAGGEAGVEAGFLRLVLLDAELGGLRGDADTGEIGLNAKDRGAHLNDEALVELGEAHLLRAERGQ